MSHSELQDINSNQGAFKSAALPSSLFCHHPQSLVLHSLHRKKHKFANNNEEKKLINYKNLNQNNRAPKKALKIKFNFGRSKVKTLSLRCMCFHNTKRFNNTWELLLAGKRR